MFCNSLKLLSAVLNCDVVRCLLCIVYYCLLLTSRYMQSLADSCHRTRSGGVFFAGEHTCRLMYGTVQAFWDILGILGSKALYKHLKSERRIISPIAFQSPLDPFSENATIFFHITFAQFLQYQCGPLQAAIVSGARAAQQAKWFQHRPGRVL